MLLSTDSCGDADAGGKGTLNATPDIVGDIGPYTLTWTDGEMRNGATVTVAATGLQDTVGNPIDPAGNSASCLGLGQAGVPLRVWPVGLVLLAVGLWVLAWRRNRAGTLLLLVLVALMAAPAAFAQAPAVSNVSFTQGPNGTTGTKVDIYYDLVAPNSPCAITVSLSKNGGADGFIYPVASVTGNLAGVTSGTGHHIEWDIRADYPEHDISQARIRITADEIETILLPGDVPLDMLWIPAGTFMMGRYAGEQNSESYEDPQHSVTLSSGFWMGKYELTKAQWTAVMGTTPWQDKGYVINDANSPAVFVSWNDAQAFTSVLNTYTGKTFRLPSEAQWEYACRADTATRFYWGDDLIDPEVDSNAWYSGNCSSEMYAHVVGLKFPNAFGLYDISGNVLEWCEDDWHWDYTDAPANGSAWVDIPRGAYRVVRGGSWYNNVGYCRSASRFISYTYSPDNANVNLGIRLVRTP